MEKTNQSCDVKAVIFDIVRSSFVDGPGIRTSVFFKGCNLNCKWCHNPESKKARPQMMFYKDKCCGCGKCAAVCPNKLQSCVLCGKCADICPKDARKICGREMNADEVYKEIQKDKRFYESSNGGATFSGGECMLQIDFLAEILKKCRENGIHTAVDTAGCVPWEYFERVLQHTDLFLYDIKVIDKEKHKKYTGADNGLILGNLCRLFGSGAKIWIRMPIIPDVNDDEESVAAVKEFLKPYSPEKIELLPYHTMGEGKYASINEEAVKFDVPDPEKMKMLRQLIE